MKTIRMCFLVLILFSLNSLSAQKVVRDGLLFPEFEKGIVYLNNGLQQAASFSYDMLQEKMLFLGPDSTVLEIGNPLDVRVVVINNRRFFPVSSTGVFYEEVTAGNGSFFIQRQAKMLSQGKALPYGGYSQTSSATSYSSLQDNRGSFVSLSPDEKFRLEIKNFYYLKSGKSYKNFFSAKTLGKLFKGHESEINEFANEQSIDFKKADDVARIVEYAYSLTSNP